MDNHEIDYETAKKTGENALKAGYLTRPGDIVTCGPVNFSVKMVGEFMNEGVWPDPRDERTDMGAQRWLQEYTESLEKEGFEAECMIFYSTGRYAAYISFTGKNEMLGKYYARRHVSRLGAVADVILQVKAARARNFDAANKKLPFPEDQIFNMLWCAVKDSHRGRDRGEGYRWAFVTDILGVGSTTAKEVCRALGLDPNEYVKG